MEPTVGAALIDRYYECFADHAVAITHQVVKRFLVSALPPEL